MRHRLLRVVRVPRAHTQITPNAPTDPHTRALRALTARHLSTSTRHSPLSPRRIFRYCSLSCRSKDAIRHSGLCEVIAADDLKGIKSKLAEPSE